MLKTKTPVATGDCKPGATTTSPNDDGSFAGEPGNKGA
jgi:hypothetical protein